MELCCHVIEYTSTKIGGPGLTVEIEETKFGKKQYKSKRLVDGVWVLGGICRETGDTFLIPVCERKPETLIPLICDYIYPGSTVISDCWRYYECLTENDFKHMSENHSLNFIYPGTEAHEQNIEADWWEIKRSFTNLPTHHERLYLYLGEYLWRKRCQKLGRDVFDYFLEFFSVNY
ncbi:hypothetical protein RF11_09820 [Thelohanellus kitauei]|uniref:ISXO2-like transposase domain-containing protein n=1 Tax=Thelohanellus kitauei TaxID=669202 RepID=A0A0C2NGW2_THEKT|nr:hypothetical protein RF11_09820 [Thelohanellus kitauei]